MSSERVKGASGAAVEAGEWLDFRGSKAHGDPWRSSAVLGGLCETGAPRRHRGRRVGEGRGGEGVEGEGEEEVWEEGREGGTRPQSAAQEGQTLFPQCQRHRCVNDNACVC